MVPPSTELVSMGGSKDLRFRSLPRYQQPLLWGLIKVSDYLLHLLSGCPLPQSTSVDAVQLVECLILMQEAVSTYTCDPSTPQAVAGQSDVQVQPWRIEQTQGQPGIHESLS